MMIRDVKPSTDEWTVKVTVLEKGHPRCGKGRGRQIKYQRLIMSDAEGTRIQASIFDRDIKVFAHKLEVAQQDRISNAVVKVIAKQASHHPKHLSMDNQQKKLSLRGWFNHLKKMMILPCCFSSLPLVSCMHTWTMVKDSISSVLSYACVSLSRLWSGK